MIVTSRAHVRLGPLAVLAAMMGWLGAGAPGPIAVPMASAQARGQYDTPPTLAARDLVPGGQLEGSDYRIDDAVPTDGFLATFTVRSDYGVFEARGPGMLAIRLGEVAALRQLKEISTSDAFVNGLKETGTELGQDLKHLVTEPVETVKAIPEGVGRFLERVGRGAKTGVQKLGALKAEQDAPAPPPPGPGANLPGARPPGEKPDVSVTAEAAKATGRVARDAFGYDDRRRSLAKQVGADPYTTNPVLAKQLDDIAWAAFAGGLGITALKTVAPASMLVSTSAMLSGWVYDMPPGDLKIRNQNALLAMGVSQEAVDHLLRHRWYSLTLQTELAHGLERLTGVAGRPAVMPLALTVASEEQARFVVRAVAMLAHHHETVTPLASVEVRGTIVGRTPARALVVPGPVDYLAWTPVIERFAQRPDLRSAAHTLWVTGQVSPRAREELTRRGWTLQHVAAGKGSATPR